jgi:hypothetical protein
MNFKFNLKIIKILLFLIVITFFAPFFSVSCGEGDSGANFSGLELSTGKYVGEYWQEGNLFGFTLIVLPVALLICSFFAAKNAHIYAICRYLFFIAPIFDIFAACIAAYAFKKIAQSKFGAVPVLIGTKPGFALYIIFNAALFAMAVVNYFAFSTKNYELRITNYELS